MNSVESIALIKQIMANSYMELEKDDDPQANVMMYTTRENGDMSNDEPGAADLQHAYQYRKLVTEKLPNVESRVEGVDEWTYLTFIIKEDV